MSEGSESSSLLAHRLLRASAGSGKTYALTSRYLALLLRGAAPSSILASTFTRLAAGEIRDRILTRLARAARDERERRELASAVGCEELSREQVLTELSALCRSLHLLNVRTLDSFFGSITKSFAPELDLPLQADAVEEILLVDLREEAIRRSLDERDPQHMIELLRRLTQNSGETRVAGRIREVVEQLAELQREADSEAWKMVVDLQPLEEHALEEALERAKACEPPKHKKWMEYHGDFIAAVHGRRWIDVVSNGIAQRIIAGESDYYGKPIAGELCSAYAPLIEHARAVVLTRLRDETQASHDLLAIYNAQYDALKREHGVMTFGDVINALRSAQPFSVFDDIAFRLDASTHHVLLDEFQDTSVIQWMVLEPMLREIVSHRDDERTFFCVGDAKQSIYGWRGAAPEVLDHLPEQFSSGGECFLDVQSLTKSYRSSQMIVDVVNEVFGTLPANECIAKYHGVARAWAAQFEAHETTKGTLSGYVELSHAPISTNNQGAARLRAAAELVHSLHQEMPGATIGVLTRSNRAIGRLLYEFSPARLNVPVSGRGGAPVTDAPAVNAMLDLLTLAEHPQDTVGAFHVVHSPLGRALALDADLANPRFRKRRAGFARTLRRRLYERGFAPVIAEWAKLVADACDERERNRVLGLIRLAEQHDAEQRGAGVRPDDFLRRVEMVRVPNVGEAPVQLMTVHMAKGLEFDLVVLPELDDPLRPNQLRVLIERENEIGRITKVRRGSNQIVRALSDELRDLYDANAARAVRESLSLLYVAMTRARQGLFMVINPSGAKGYHSDTAARLLRKALKPNVEHGDHAHDERGMKKVFVHGNLGRVRESLRGRLLKAARASESAMPPIRFAERDATEVAWRRGVKARAASAHDIDDERVGETLRDLFNVGSNAARERGSGLHLLFQQIEWIEEWRQNDTTLRALMRREFPLRDDAWLDDVLQRFAASLERPAVRGALSRGNAEGQRRLWRERPFARNTSTGLQQGAIDRITAVIDGQGRTTRAHVQDFKSDEVTAAQCTARAKRYHDQIRVYREVTAELLQIDPTAITTSLIFIVPGVVVDVA